MSAIQGISQQTGAYDDPMDLCPIEGQAGHISCLPDELIVSIFSHLDHVGVVKKASLVCESWRVLACEESLWKAIFYRELVFFGEKNWEELGYKVDIPEIDSYRRATIESLIWAKQKWPEEWDKKMMFLKPKEIIPLGTSERIPLTPIKIGEIIGLKLGAPCNPDGYEYFWPDTKQEHGGKGLQETCFVYMTPDVIPDSRNKSYAVQIQLVDVFGGEVPDLLSAILGIFLKAYKTGLRLFPKGDQNKPGTFTRLRESIQNWQLIVVGFAPAGLMVSFLGFDDFDIGVAAMRKFKALGT